MDESADDIAVIDNPDRSRFEVYRGNACVGYAEYNRGPDSMVFTHTEVDPAEQGHGLAARLARTGLEAARELGLRVTPLCSYIAAYISRHPDYLPLVDDQHRAQLAGTPTEHGP